MIETLSDLVVFTVFGSAIWFLILVVALIVSLFISEHQEEGFGGFGAVVVFVIINNIWGNVPLVELVTWVNVITYLVIGFLFSLVRTYFKGKELTKEYDKLTNKNSHDTLEKYKKSFRLSEHVFRWWLMFPISMLHWLFGTLLKDLFTRVYDKVESLYNKIFNL